MCYLIAKNIDDVGCVTLRTTHGKYLSEFKRSIEARGGRGASPVYYTSANATLIACLDCLFLSTSFDKTMKVGASVVCARRGGCSSTFDETNFIK